MPYHIVKRGREYCVVRDADSRRSQRTIACHDTRSKAEDQIKAIEANEHK